MTEDHLDAERMTAHATSGASLSSVEAAHLAGCAECRLELEILTAATRLGTSELARFDPARVAAAVRSRLEAEPSRVPGRIARHPMRWLAGLAAAAAIVFSVYLGMPKRSPGSVQLVAAAPAPSVLPELDGLSASELEEVLRSIPPASEALDHVDMAPLGDLDANQLERMLRSMEE